MGWRMRNPTIASSVASHIDLPATNIKSNYATQSTASEVNATLDHRVSLQMSNRDHISICNLLVPKYSDADDSSPSSYIRAQLAPSCYHGIATMPQVASARPHAPTRRHALSSSSRSTAYAYTTTTSNTKMSSPTETSGISPSMSLLLPLVDFLPTGRPAETTRIRLRPEPR